MQRLFPALAGLAALVLCALGGSALAGTKTPLVNYSGVVQPIKSTDNALVPSLGGSGVQCLQTDNTGQITGFGAGCGAATANPFPIGSAQIGVGPGTAPITTFCPNTAGDGSLCLSDTLGLAYSMFVPPATAPARVQEKQSDDSFSFTLGAAPTVGDYLWAACGQGSASGSPAVPSPSAGWTSYATQSGTLNRHPAVLIVYRAVQSGDSATETPCTGTIDANHFGAVSVLEVSGLDPDIIGNSVEAGSFATADNNSDVNFSVTQTATTANNNDLAVTLAPISVGSGGLHSIGAISLNAGWTNVVSTPANSHLGGGIAGSKTVGSSGTLVTQTVSVVDTASQMAGGGATAYLLIFKPTTDPFDTGWQQLSYLNVCKNAGSSLTTNCRSLNFSTGLTASSDADGNVTITNTGVTSCGAGLTGSSSCALSAPVTVANGGTGQTTYTDGQLLIGDSSTNGLDKATLTAGTNISITNGHGTITITGTGGGGGGTVTSITCTQGLTGGAITVSGTCAFKAMPSPGIRLTLASGTPVMTSDQTAKSTVYVDCYINAGIPYYDGSNDQMDTDPSCETSLTMQTSGTGVTNNAGVFDVWWSVANHKPCVATNGSGGGWASDTGGSNTARGTGYSQVHNTRGYWTNVNSISHCYNGSTDYGSISADQATYLGSLYTTAAGQTGMAFHPAVANGGTNNILGLWNAYNRVEASAFSRDNTSSWSYGTATWRSADNSASNRISWVDGLGQSSVGSTASGFISGTAGSSASIGADLDSTSAAPNVAATAFPPASQGEYAVATDSFSPQIGFHFVQEVEAANTGSSMTFNGAGATPTRQWENLVLGYQY